MVSGLFQQVYHIVARIPPAKVVTYGRIALSLDLPGGDRTSSCRAVTMEHPAYDRAGRTTQAAER